MFFYLPVVIAASALHHARFTFATTRVGVSGAAVRRKWLFTGKVGGAVARGDLFA
jgi:hypothetical protein